MKKLILISLIISSYAFAGAPKRLKAIRFDKSRTEKIYLTPGLASVVSFPCQVSEVIVGRKKAVSAVISEVSSKNLILSLSSSSSGATNLIVRCSNSLYVFDLVPSRTIHQDVVRISGSFGGPERVEGNLKLIAHSRLPIKKHVDKVLVLPPKLIEQKGGR